MKNTKIIRYLTEYNEWRRGGEGEQPNPIRLGVVIDHAIEKLELHDRKMKDMKAKLSLSESIVDAGVGELRFANMQNEILYNALEEISVMTSDNLSKKVVGMAMERHKLDKLIHAREIFGEKPEGFADIF